MLLHLLLVLAAGEENSGLCSQHKHACCCMNVLLLPYSPSCRLPLLRPLLLPRLALLLLLLQPSCFFSGSTALRNTSSCFSALRLCFSESNKQMRTANKSEKGSPLLPFALLDLPLPWQLLSLLSRSRFPGKSPARKTRPSTAAARCCSASVRRTRFAASLRPGGRPSGFAFDSLPPFGAAAADPAPSSLICFFFRASSFRCFLRAALDILL